MNLYDLTHEYQTAANSLVDLDLPDDVVQDTLDGLRFPVEQKATNVAFVIRNLESLAEQIKQAEAEMTKRRKAVENRAARIKQYLLSNMQIAGIHKIESPYFNISVRNNPESVVVDNEALLPAIYLRQPETPPPAPDKKAIAAAIKLGVQVEGAHLIQTQRLEIK